MNADQLKEMAERISSGLADEEEIIGFNKMVDSFSPPGEWDESIHGNKEAIHRSMQHKINVRISDKTGGIQFNWRRLAIAASIILVLSPLAIQVSKYWNSNRQNANGTTGALVTNDVPPGKQGAILSLANGQQILLDSAANGKLANQGDIEVVKKDGQLIYVASGDAEKAVYNTVSTPNGRQFSLVLSDGSKVWLNAASAITYPTVFEKTQRVVRVIGEAYFEVAHNSKWPFIVERDSLSVTVLGTHFNINSYPDEKSTSVTLLEGAVTVKNKKESLLLKPGQQAQTRHDDKISLVNKPDLEVVMAWKNGLFHFENADVETVMRQLSRWYDVQIIYKKPKPKDDEPLFVEVSRNANLSDVLKALEIIKGDRFKMEGKNIIVY